MTLSSRVSISFSFFFFLFLSFFWPFFADAKETNWCLTVHDDFPVEPHRFAKHFFYDGCASSIIYFRYLFSSLLFLLVAQCTYKYAITLIKNYLPH